MIKNFLLFTEQKESIDCLTDGEAGQMIKALYAYAANGEMPEFTGPLMAMFKMLRSQMDRSQDAYRKKCEKNSENARKRYEGKKKEESCDGMPSHANACLPNPNPSPNPNPNPSPNPNPDIDEVVNTPIIYNSADAQEKVCEDYTFDEVWKLYDKPVGDAKELRQRWRELPPDDRRRIMEYVPLYLQKHDKRRFRKDFSNFLTSRTWETEPITIEDIEYGNKNQFSNQPNAGKRISAYRNAGMLVSRLIAEARSDAPGPGGAQEPVSHAR